MSAWCGRWVWVVKCGGLLCRLPCHPPPGPAAPELPPPRVAAGVQGVLQRAPDGLDLAPGDFSQILCFTEEAAQTTASASASAARQRAASESRQQRSGRPGAAAAASLEMEGSMSRAESSEDDVLLFDEGRSVRCCPPVGVATLAARPAILWCAKFM